jgi:hypothetical protein
MGGLELPISKHGWRRTADHFESIFVAGQKNVGWQDKAIPHGTADDRGGKPKLHQGKPSRGYDGENISIYAKADMGGIL